MLSRHHAHAGADGAPVRLGSHTLHLQPAILRWGVVAQERRRLIHVDDDHIDVAIVIEVPECRSAAGPGLCNHCAARGRDVGKTSVPQISVENLPLLEGKVQFLAVDLREDVTVAHEYVGPAVIVDIAEAYAPA